MLENISNMPNLKRIKTYLLLLLMFACNTSCNTLKTSNETVKITNTKKKDKSTLRSYYEFIDSTNPYDDLPSKCDCDYHKIGLYLMQDSTFTMIDQKGRLEIISLDKKYGTWALLSTKMLQLDIDSTLQYATFDTIKERFNPSEVIRMEISKNKLIYDYDKVLVTNGNGI